jgi:hypothetical protein
MKRTVVIKIHDLDYLEVVVKPSKVYGGGAHGSSRPGSGEPTIGNNIPSGLWGF